MISEIDFMHLVSSVSVILGTLVALSGVVAIIYGARWKTAAQVEAANAAAWEATASRLEREVSELREQLRRHREEIDKLRARISELEHLPDVATVYKALQEHDARAAEAMKMHDANAEKRANRIIAVMEEIRDNLKRGGSDG